MVVAYYETRIKEINFVGYSLGRNAEEAERRTLSQPSSIPIHLSFGPKVETREVTPPKGSLAERLLLEANSN